MSESPGETITTDLCPLDFPPEIYGETPDEVEATIQQVVERVFRDEDDLLRSGVYGKTMEPITADDVHDRPYGVGGYAENHAMPHAYKLIYLNYENAEQASGKYLRAMLRKHAVTGDDYRNMFWAEGHVCWLNAYWDLRLTAQGEREP